MRTLLSVWRAWGSLGEHQATKKVREYEIILLQLCEYIRMAVRQKPELDKSYHYCIEYYHPHNRVPRSRDTLLCFSTPKPPLPIRSSSLADAVCLQ